MLSVSNAFKTFRIILYVICNFLKMVFFFMADFSLDDTTNKQIEYLKALNSCISIHFPYLADFREYF